jgi:hypothetical protein
VILPQNGPHTFLWSTGSTDTTLTGLAAGTYSVRIVNAQNCFEDVSYTVSDPYEITFGGIAAPTCPGGLDGMATLNSTGCQCMFSTCTFLWDNGVTVKPNFTLPEGWSSVVINHPDGCVVVDSVFVPFSEAILDSIVVSPVACHGDSTGAINLLADANFQPVNFLWPNGNVASFEDSLLAGDYFIRMTDARGCLDSVLVNVAQNNPINFSVSTLAANCFGDSSGTIDLSISGGVAPYALSINNQPWAGLLNEFAAGTYSLSLIDSLGCATGDTSITIGQPDAISVSYSVITEPLPNTNSGIITAHVVGGTPPYSFLWNDPNQQTDSVASYLNTGWYQVQVTDSNGCNFSDSVFVDFLGIEEMKGVADVFLFPNPATDKVSFNKTVKRASLFTPQGKLLLYQENKQTLDIENIPAGVYFLEVVTDEQASRFQLIKSK